jgi:hypothetical protein
MSKGSAIVFLSSLAARAVVGTIPAYAATKGAIDTLVKHFASMLGARAKDEIAKWASEVTDSTVEGSADSQLESMYECGRRTSGWIGLIPEVHCRDKTAVHSEYVQNLAVRKNIPLKALDELVHPDACFASVFLGHCKRLDMGIEFTPLSSPVGADLFFSDNLPALRSLGPAHVLRHQC